MISKKTLFETDIPFQQKCQKVFEYQSVQSAVYRDFLNFLGHHVDKEIHPETVPLLPIRAFRQKAVLCDGLEAKLTFKSSGTGGMTRSSHHISDPDLYKTAILNEFTKYFPLEEFSLLCYMPGYQENINSSLIWMARYLIQNDPDQLSCFLPDNNEAIEHRFQQIDHAGKKILLFGAAFGLLDLIEAGKIPNGYHLQVLETGGMKTHRREMSKVHLRNVLSEGFQVDASKIHSEYGMCELLSQMYAIGGAEFTSPEWVYITIRENHNPLMPCKPGKEGKIGVIDLANLYSCSFILTDDRGVMDHHGRFQVLGRWSNTNLRGCNFLIDV